MDEFGATRAVAEYICRETLESAPAGAAAVGARVIADSIATIISGATSDVAPVLAEYLSRNLAPGPARIVGTVQQVAPETAALINGTLGHALDYDDVVTLYPGHPSQIVVSALLAASALEPVDGHRFLEAFVIGSEVGAKVARGIGLGHYHRGWHATGTLCMFAAVGALAKLRRLAVDEVETAIGVACSFSSGLQRNFGTMTKPFHAGWAARNAYLAVDLATIGWTANRQMLETERGFFDVYGGPDRDPERVAALLGHPHVLVDPGLALKKYPCCWASHRAIDAVFDLKAAGRADEVAHVECRLPDRAFKQLQYHRPTNALEAKFSGEYAVAAAVLDGAAGFREFSDDAVARPEIRELYDRIEMVEDPRCSGESTPDRELSPGELGWVEMTVTFTDGSVRSTRVDAPVGSPSRPMTWGDIREKFLDCASLARMDLGLANQVMDGFENLDAVDDVGSLFAQITLDDSVFATALSSALKDKARSRRQEATR